MLAQYRLPFIDLDAICKQLLLPNQPGWQALQKVLADNFFSQSGHLDRRVLREAIFTDASLRTQIDTLLHPLARQAMTEQLFKLDAPVVLAEIPLLFEVGWQDTVDLIIVVYAPIAVRLERIIQRDQVTIAQALMAINSQHCLFAKARQADHVIDNSRNWPGTILQLQRLVRSHPCGKRFFTE
ncbi:MAG: dephospho-CoA kinase [Candidatus Electrothrix sp. AR3]|nr:dephospho-CoA kinase [Candidatus Electrothrix sp. AR3]